MNIFWKLCITFGVLALIAGVLMFLFANIAERDEELFNKKIKKFLIITVNSLLVLVAVSATFGVIGSEKDFNEDMRNFFIEENYKETIDYADFININKNKSEITYAKGGSLFTLEYEYKAKDFNVRDGIQVYVSHDGTVGVK